MKAFVSIPIIYLSLAEPEWYIPFTYSYCLSVRYVSICLPFYVHLSICVSMNIPIIYLSLAKPEWHIPFIYSSCLFVRYVSICLPLCTIRVSMYLSVILQVDEDRLRRTRRSLKAVMRMKVKITKVISGGRTSNEVEVSESAWGWSGWVRELRRVSVGSFREELSGWGWSWVEVGESGWKREDPSVNRERSR